MFRMKDDMGVEQVYYLYVLFVFNIKAAVCSFITVVIKVLYRNIDLKVMF